MKQQKAIEATRAIGMLADKIGVAKQVITTAINSGEGGAVTKQDIIDTGVKAIEIDGVAKDSIMLLNMFVDSSHSDVVIPINTTPLNTVKLPLPNTTNPFFTIANDELTVLNDCWLDLTISYTTRRIGNAKGIFSIWAVFGIVDNAINRISETLVQLELRAEEQTAYPHITGNLLAGEVYTLYSTSLIRETKITTNSVNISGDILTAPFSKATGFVVKAGNNAYRDSMLAVKSNRQLQQIEKSTINAKKELSKITQKEIDNARLILDKKEITKKEKTSNESLLERYNILKNIESQNNNKLRLHYSAINKSLNYKMENRILTKKDDIIIAKETIEINNKKLETIG